MFFKKKLDKQGFIKYRTGADNFITHEDDPELKEADEKVAQRLDKIKDMLFRYGSTGVMDVVKIAVEKFGMIPVYPVKNVHSFICDNSGHVFKDCFLVRKGTTVKDFAHILGPEFEKNFSYAELVNGLRMGEDDAITTSNNIFRIVTQIASE